MKYLKIKNNGELDIRLVALMGGTTKSNDEFKIGQFGTGLKYTLAFLYRNNLDFKIFIGNEEVKLAIETEEIAGEVFEIICVNGHRTSITTKMGCDWDAWMIIRELWCNALDEGGAEKEETTEIVGHEKSTTFYIQIDSQIREVLNNWRKYFIHDETPVSTGGAYSIYPAGPHLCIYKQGVLIHENEGLKAVFSYDVKNASINELRQFQGSISQVITNALYVCNENAAAYFLENVTDEHYEGKDNFDYGWFGSFNECWRKVIGNGKLIYQKIIDDMQARGNTVDLLDKIIVPRSVYKALTKQFEGVGALRVASKIGDFYEDFDDQIDLKIKQGLVILEECGYTMHPHLEFKYGFFEDKAVLAKVAIDQKIIYVSKTMLQKPLFTVVSMLIEENEHFNTGMQDETRAFQQHFIDLYTRTLLAKHEIEI
jgi:hypothetical protein